MQVPRWISLWRGIIMTWVVLGLVWDAAVVEAATYYVATTGSAGNPGTQAQPFRTIAAGMATMRSGDTLLIRAGTYAETINGYTHPIPSGTSWATATTFAAYPGEQPVIRGCFDTGSSTPSYVIFKDFICDGSGDPDPTGGSVTTGHFIRVEHLEIKNYTGNGLYVHTPASHIEILANRVHHNSHNFFDQGIYHAGSFSRIDGNEVYSNGAFGLQVWKDGGGNDGNVIVNNVVHDNGGGGTCCAGIAVGFGHDTLVENNVVYNEAGTGIQITNNGYTRDNQVRNNTLHNVGVGIMIGPGGEQTVVTNNRFSSVTTAVHDLGRGSRLAANSTTSQPFVIPSAGTVGAAAGSPVSVGDVPTSGTGPASPASVSAATLPVRTPAPAG